MEAEAFQVGIPSSQGIGESKRKLSLAMLLI
jgi:hypothetical protein